MAGQITLTRPTAWQRQGGRGANDIVNMSKLFKSSKFPTPLFIVASLATFFAFGIIYFFAELDRQTNFSQGEPAPYQYYLNKEYSKGDPYITKNPGLADMLTGPIISDLDPHKGGMQSPVTIVLFSDYVCSFCEQQEETIKQILLDFEGSVSLIWKDYPENNPESISWQAALAARCAGEQDAYWLFHDLLYQNNNNLNQTTFVALARELNLNLEIFKDCLSSERTANLVKDNIIEANALGIKGIPFLYVNDQEVMGEITYDELKEMAELEMGKAR